MCSVFVVPQACRTARSACSLVLMDALPCVLCPAVLSGFKKAASSFFLGLLVRAGFGKLMKIMHEACLPMPSDACSHATLLLVLAAALRRSTCGPTWSWAP